MNFLRSLFQHNKAWILPILGSAAYAAGTSLHDGHVNIAAVASAALVTAAGLAKSPVGATPAGAAQDLVQSVIAQTAANVEAGATVGSQSLVTAAEQVAAGAVADSVNPDRP